MNKLNRPELYFDVFYQNGYCKLTWMTEKEWEEFQTLFIDNESVLLYCQTGELEMIGCSKNFANFVLNSNMLSLMFINI